LYSDPTYGHAAADTSGWVDHEEPGGEADWIFDKPERYLYGESGGLRAMGRVAADEVDAYMVNYLVSRYWESWED